MKERNLLKKSVTPTVSGSEKSRRATTVKCRRKKLCRDKDNKLVPRAEQTVKNQLIQVYLHFKRESLIPAYLCCKRETIIQVYLHFKRESLIQRKGGYSALSFYSGVCLC